MRFTAGFPEPLRCPQPCTALSEQTLRPFISPRGIPHGGPLMQHCVFPEQPVGQGRCPCSSNDNGLTWALEHRRRLDKAPMVLEPAHARQQRPGCSGPEHLQILEGEGTGDGVS